MSCCKKEIKEIQKEGGVASWLKNTASFLSTKQGSGSV
jgi:hypothetical protein